MKLPTELLREIARDNERTAESRRQEPTPGYDIDADGRLVGFTVTGWRTDQDAEAGERADAHTPEGATRRVWHMLHRGCAQVIVERTGPDGRVAYQEGGS